MEKSHNSTNHATTGPDWKEIRDFVQAKAESESLDVVENSAQMVSSQDVADVLSLLGSYLHSDGNRSDVLVVETLVREYGWTVNRGVKALDRVQAWRLHALAATRMVEVAGLMPDASTVAMGAEQNTTGDLQAAQPKVWYLAA